jgi:hypothetical protein
MTTFLPSEYILTMGYYPDHHAETGTEVDVFMFHVKLPDDFDSLEPEWQHDLYWDTLAEAVDLLLEACMGKYHLVPLGAHRKISRVLHPMDLFWKVELRPEQQGEL